MTRFGFCSYKKENENEEFIWGGLIGISMLCNVMDGVSGNTVCCKENIVEDQDLEERS